MQFARTLFIPALALAFIFTGCKKNDDGPATPNTAVPASMVGTWTPTAASLNGQSIDPAQFFQYTSGAVTAKFTFNADGSYRYDELDSSNASIYNETGTVTISGQDFTISANTANGQPQNPPQVLKGTYVIAGNQLTISASIPAIGAAVVVMTKQ